MVDELVDQNTRRWNYGLIQTIFSPEEVNVICSIQLSEQSPPDYLIWHYEHQGRFTVKSAYHIACSWIQPTNNGASSSTLSSNMLWSKLWNANVPPKVKICVWRLLNEQCPTRANLARRHITTEVECLLCNFYGETIIHIMRECPYAKCAWMASGLGACLREDHHSSVLEWGIEIARLLHKSSFELFLMICWALWGARNEKLWQEKLEPPDVCVDRARQRWSAFVKANVVTPASNSGTSGHIKWMVPLLGCLKVNIDGS